MRDETILALCVLTASAAGYGPPERLLAQSEPSAAEVIDRVLQAYGGLPALRSVESYRQEGMLVASRDGAHGRVYRVSRGAARLSVLVDYPGRSEIRLLEDGSAWRGVDIESLADVEGPLRGAMVLQGARANLPWLLDDFRDATTLEGATEGRTALVVRIADDLILRVFVDDETGHIVRTDSNLESLPGMAGFATDYSDFRLVEDILVAFHEETFASGYHTATTLIESVEFNPVGGRARLPMPQGGR